MKYLLFITATVISMLAQASTLKCFIDEELGPKYYITKDLADFDGSPVSIGQIGGLPVKVDIWFTGLNVPTHVSRICAHVRTSGDYQRICSESKLNLVRLVQVNGRDKIESIYISCEISQ